MAAASVLGSSVAARAIHGGFGHAAMARQSLGMTSLRADFLSLDERLAGAEPCSDRPLAIASIPLAMCKTAVLACGVLAIRLR
jgi:hypothetical protein